MDDPRFAREYVAFIDRRVPLVCVACFLLGLVPVLGVIPAVILYRLAIVAPFRRYIPPGRSFVLRWGVRLVSLVLVAFQWVPVPGRAAPAGDGPDQLRGLSQRLQEAGTGRVIHVGSCRASARRLARTRRLTSEGDIIWDVACNRPIFRMLMASMLWRPYGPAPRPDLPGSRRIVEERTTDADDDQIGDVPKPPDSIRRARRRNSARVQWTWQRVSREYTVAWHQGMTREVTWSSRGTSLLTNVADNRGASGEASDASRTCNRRLLERPQRGTISIRGSSIPESATSHGCKRPLPMDA